MNVFGLRSMYSLILGENNAADQTRIMQEQMSGAAMALQQDPQKAFKVQRQKIVFPVTNVFLQTFLHSRCSLQSNLGFRT